MSRVSVGRDATCANCIWFLRKGCFMDRQDGGLTPVVREDLLLDVNDVAAMLRRSVRSVYDDVKAGRLPAGFRLGGRRRWRRADIETAIAKLAGVT